MNDPEIMQRFVDAGAIITDSHFVYNSGRHSSVYINKDALYLHTGIISQFCQSMVQPYDANQINVVVGPVLGGIVLSQWTAHHLNNKRATGETLAVYAEKEQGSDQAFAFYRSYDQHIPGKNILIVEDILTTGGSVRRVIELVRRHGGNVMGVSALCNRGNVQPKDVGNVPIHTLITLDLETYTQEDCPFCKQQVPINTSVGNGRMFLAKQKAL